MTRLTNRQKSLLMDAWRSRPHGVRTYDDADMAAARRLRARRLLSFPLPATAAITSDGVAVAEAITREVHDENAG